MDELYGLLFTRRTMDAARGVYATDSRVIDGAVNGAAWLTRQLSRFTGNVDRLVVDGAVNGVAGFIKLLMSPLLRAAQTGVTANYALVMVLGLVAAVGLFFGAGIISGRVSMSARQVTSSPSSHKFASGLVPVPGVQSENSLPPLAHHVAAGASARSSSCSSSRRSRRAPSSASRPRGSRSPSWSRSPCSATTAGAGGFQFLEDCQWIPVIGARYQMGVPTAWPCC